MTGLAITRDSFVGWGGWLESSGASETYKELNHSIEEAESYRTAENNGEAKLFSIVAYCSEENWDGYGSKPVNAEVLQLAWHLLGKLPVGVFPTPDVVAEPDGEIAIEWEGNDGSIFSVSVGVGRRLAYAGRFVEGEEVNRVRGVEHWNGRGIPKTLLEYISRAVY